MVELADEALDQARDRAETMTLDELVRIVETRHPDEGPGVAREVFDAYLAELGYDVEEVGNELDAQLLDSRNWAETDGIYEVGEGRISNFPALWHERLSGTTDLTEYVRVIEDDVEETYGRVEDAVTRAGVPEQLLFRAMAAISNVEREDAREQLARLRRQGVVDESTDQHPAGTVRLSEEYPDSG